MLGILLQQAIIAAYISTSSTYVYTDTGEGNMCSIEFW